MAGAARLFCPVFESGGNWAGSFWAVSAHCAKAASTLAGSNGCWPRIICDTLRALSLLPFISAMRVAIGSDCARTDVAAAAAAKAAAARAHFEIMSRYLPMAILWNSEHWEGP